MLLVGDSLGMVVQGLDTTLPVTRRRDDLPLSRGRARQRGARIVVGDMPFMSYQVSPEQALKNAGALPERGRRAGRQARGRRRGRRDHPQARERRHPGDGPRRAHAAERARDGRLQGAGQDREDGRSACSTTPAPWPRPAPSRSCSRASRATSRRASPPSSRSPPSASAPARSCDGQVLVCYDLLGLTPNLRPKFVKRYAELSTPSGKARRAAYCEEVQDAARSRARSTASATCSAAPSAAHAAAATAGVHVPARLRPARTEPVRAMTDVIHEPRALFARCERARQRGARDRLRAHDGRAARRAPVAGATRARARGADAASWSASS